MKLFGLFLIGVFEIFLVSNSAEAASLSGKCAVGQHWVRAHYRRGYYRADGTRVSEAQVRAHCAVNRKSEIWRSRLVSGLPLDWPRHEIGSSWSVEEIERALETLESIPPQLWSDKVKIFRAKKSVDFPNPASSSNGAVVIYDSAFGDGRNLGKVLVHELAHQFYKNLNSTEAGDYGLSTGWLVIDKSRPIQDPKRYFRRSNG